MRCPDCKEEFIVAFSCRQRSCCPACDQKRALLLGSRLKDEVSSDVPHRQWVFTIPKRFRVFFRFDRSLLGKLCRAAYDTVREVHALELDGDPDIPAMVGAVQTFGDLIHWHSHIHAIKCPMCGGTMKIISIIECHQSEVIEKILRHRNLWKKEPPRPPPPEAVSKPGEPILD